MGKYAKRVDRTVQWATLRNLGWGAENVELVNHH